MLLRVMRALKGGYEGSLEKLHDAAADYADLEKKIRSLGSGIGPATANIFLRELRGVWAKATPPLSPPAQAAAEHLKLAPTGLSPEAALAALEGHWQRQPVPGADFADLEAALVRLGRDFCRKPRASPCPMGPACGRGRE